jgi:hypothetical protein
MSLSRLDKLIQELHSKKAIGRNCSGTFPWFFTFRKKSMNFERVLDFAGLAKAVWIKVATEAFVERLVEHQNNLPAFNVPKTSLFDTSFMGNEVKQQPRVPAEMEISKRSHFHPERFFAK